MNLQVIEQYFSRNSLWLKSMIGGLLIAIAPVLVCIIDPTLLGLFPVKTLSILGISIAGFSTGIGAFLTDTKSAGIVRFFGTAAGFAALLFFLF